jgi:hypothetical protein
MGIMKINKTHRGGGHEGYKVLLLLGKFILN